MFARLVSELTQFVEEREWGKYHTNKNLSMSLSREVSELSEHFTWLNEEESFHIMENEKAKVAIENEYGDVFNNLVLFSLMIKKDLKRLGTERYFYNLNRYKNNNSEYKQREEAFGIEEVFTINGLMDRLIVWAENMKLNKRVSPKNLVLDLVFEAGELLEHFIWVSDEESKNFTPNEIISWELADTLHSLLLLAHHLKIDPVKVALKKLALTREKYPAMQVKGCIKKYYAFKNLPYQ